MEQAGKFDDIEVAALSCIIHGPIHCGTLNRKIGYTKNGYALDLAALSK